MFHVQAASDASFAFPNISPQHRAFNQSLLNGVWGELENYVLDNTVAEVWAVIWPQPEATPFTTLLASLCLQIEYAPRHAHIMCFLEPIHLRTRFLV